MALPYPEPELSPPSQEDLLEELEAAVMDTEVVFETSDGCMVEPDGICQHGHPTWLVRYGLI